MWQSIYFPNATPILKIDHRAIGRIFHSLVLGVLLLSTDLYAAGFAITENSGKGLGLAFAGGGAIANDGSTVWYNPAGMVLVGDTLQFTASYVNPNFNFVNDGSVQLSPAGDMPLLPASSEFGGGGTSAIVPTIFLVRQLSDHWSFGIGLNAPFGLTTEYDANWIGRYQAVKSEIVTLNLNPALAYKFNDHFSIGAGLNINYMDAKLTNAIDFAAVCGSAISALCPNGSVPGQGQFDGFVSNTADDISVGGNIGVLWSPSEATRVGLAYRSQIDHTLTGDVDFSAPTELGGFPALGPLGAALDAPFSDGEISSRVSLPDTASASVLHRITNTITLVGDVTWTNWADIPELRIDFANPLTPPASESLNWHDAWRVSAGIIIVLNDRWTVRSGYAHDQSPVPNATDSTARLPDNDRQWLAIGVSHRFSNALSVDAGYAHLFIDDTPITRLGTTGNALTGAFDSSADILSLQINYASY